MPQLYGNCQSKLKGKVAALILAGGSATRMRGVDKALVHLLGQPSILYSYKSFQATGLIDEYVIICRDVEQLEHLRSLFKKEDAVIHFVLGGKERQDSVDAGLHMVSPACHYVMIHDVARPLILPCTIKAILQALVSYPAVAAAHKIVDTVREADCKEGSGEVCVLRTIPRGKLWGMETPQAFEKSILIDSYRKIKESHQVITDDLEAVIQAGYRVKFVENRNYNRKMTYFEDIEMIERVFKNRMRNSSFWRKLLCRFV